MERKEVTTVDLRHVVTCVSMAFSVREEAMLAKEHDATARGLADRIACGAAAWIARRVTLASWREIGAALGGRGVSHAQLMAEVCASRMRADARVEGEVRKALEMIGVRSYEILEAWRAEGVDKSSEVK